MAGLVLLMCSVATLKVRQQVEADLAVRLGVLDGRALAGRLQRLVVTVGVLEREWCCTPEDERVEASHRHAAVEAVLECGAEVADGMELLVQPGALECLRVLAQMHSGLRVVFSALRKLGEARLCREHARLHGAMRALDPGHVQEASAVANERAAREVQLGQALDPSLGNSPGAVGDALAALQHLADGRVVLPALELFVGVHVGVLVVECHHEAEADLVVLPVVHEGAAVGLGVHRPAESVSDLAQHVLGVWHLPNLLDANPVGLVLGAGCLAQLVALEQLTRE
mmetsp:Transcript_7224/g.30750  ORF Transcript_7224/g.30750 Transcript_7224/m.30750 type:complete len:284 (+) Transcript_7224:277-1128(+)